jgi:PAS domain S-box-containing protein
MRTLIMNADGREPSGAGGPQVASVEEAEALLTAMASGLFPTGFPGLDRLTWKEKGAASPEEHLSPEERLRAAEARFRTLVEQIPAVTFMAVLGEGKNEVYVSPHIEAMLGFTQTEWLENPFLWYYQLHPDDRKLWNEEFTRGCQTGGPFRAECRFVARDGHLVWVLGEARLVKDELGRPQFLQGVAFDITQNKRAQEVLVTEAVRTAKIEEELRIARRVQTSIVPRTFEVPGLDIAATMDPTEDVGGDYYDVLPDPHGAWLAIGDVSGHGLNAGLIMLMVQSAMAAMIRSKPGATPAELVAMVNGVLHDNISARLGSDEYVTLLLLRYRRDGGLTFAGAHQNILVLRKETGKVERIITPGPWLGIRREVDDITIDTTARLHDGDLMVLFTDGHTDAKDPHQEQFDIHRVCAIVEEHGNEEPRAVIGHLMAAVRSWMARQEDDISLLVARYRSLV